ncbi:DUF4957 domain-containing protein [Pedobacter xixiisoli]|uniref:Fibronectin type-III domain-containing protein n=1 Tax=Pedobacter xixiisoli TaxID=1476464 RepID=A0A285ZR47_9SPHI|nr:DUF4957 domain-containing protein [Pedobacter xixiisoli]SOD12146.1 protein of unknown function [Pedobacter xixiisoli]
MKTKIFFKNGWYLLLAVILSTAIYSCKKSDPNEGLEAPRIFKPSGITVRAAETSAKITWTAPLLTSNLKLSYAAEFSQDSTFATSEFTMQVDTAGLTVGEEKIKVRKKYYVRVKALSTNGQPESNWMVSRSFTITGEQYFLPLYEPKVRETQARFNWIKSSILNKIVITKKDGASTDHVINGNDGLTVITGLEAGTAYQAEIFEGTKSKGYLEFATRAAVTYHAVLNPGDDLVAAVTAAPNNAIIGLNPGTYSAGTSNFQIDQKSITLRSISGEPTNTKINFKEFVLNGTGAGIKFDGVELDGAASASLYFLNLVSGNNNADVANFEPISIYNCIVHNATTSLFRANRGASAGSYKMDNITINYSLIYDIGSTLGYHFLHLDKLQFNTLNVKNSTLYNIGRAFLTCSTVIPSNNATINIDYCTFNNFGASNHYALMDAGSNPVRFNFTNNIITNVPRSGATVNADALRATGAGSGVVFSNNNVFNFKASGTGANLNFPSNITVQANNLSENLNWVYTTVDFKIPNPSPLRTASTKSSPIGDPRWIY